MKISVLALSSLALGAAMVSSAQTPPTKVGIIHIQNAILGTKDGQKALQELEARSAPKKKELERRQAEIIGLQEQLNKSSNVGGEEAKQKLIREIDQTDRLKAPDLLRAENVADIGVRERVAPAFRGGNKDGAALQSDNFFKIQE